MGLSRFCVRFLIYVNGIDEQGRDKFVMGLWRESKNLASIVSKIMLYYFLFLIYLFFSIVVFLVPLVKVNEEENEILTWNLYNFVYLFIICNHGIEISGNKLFKLWNFPSLFLIWFSIVDPFWIGETFSLFSLESISSIDAEMNFVRSSCGH